MTDKTLQPIEQKTVTFYEDELTAVVVEEGGKTAVYVPIRPVCDFLDIAWTAQRQRILRDPILSDEMTPVIVTITGTGQQVESLALPLDFLNGWLFGINANRVKAEARDKLLRYQRECYRVLSEAFLGPQRPLSPSTAALMQVREMGLAIVRMAEEQIEFDRRLGQTETAVTSLTERVQRLETGSPETAVTEAQASQLSQAVKAVAIAQGKVSGRNEFGAVYGEMYRKFGITSYKLLPASKFSDCMRWLTDWHEELTGERPF